MNKKEQIKHILETEDNVDIITNKICKLYEINNEERIKLPEKIKNLINFPKPISERNYDILSFKQDSGMTDLWTYFDNQGWARNNNGRMETKPYRTLDDIINNHLDGGVKYNIYSVKRLSDNTIFTLGDRVQLFTHNHTNKVLDNVIKEFKIVNNQIQLQFPCSKCTVLLQNAIKLVTYPQTVDIDAVQADYKITAFKHKHALTSTPVSDLSINIYLNQPDWEIYEVIRLADNVKFIVGDIVSMFKGLSVVKSFRIISNGELIMDFTNGCSTTGISSNTNKLKALFTTEDSIDIFEGDYYYLIDNNFIVNILKAVNNTVNYLNYKTFSTKSAAENYIILNKPCLSIKEIAPIFGRYHLCNSKEILDKLTDSLKELVKTKLND